MSILKAIRGFFVRGADEQPVRSDNNLTEHFRMFLGWGIEPSCPDCEEAEWLAGPRAGICQSVQCKSCQSKFNVCVAAGQLIRVDRI